MKLHDVYIKKINEMTGSSRGRSYRYDPGKCWPETSDFELVLQREMAFELGGSGKPAVNFTCVTTNPDFFSGDEILVYGPDLKQIKEDLPYTRITIIQTEDQAIGSEAEDQAEKTFRAIQKMDFVKYHVFPKGYMVRTSGQTSREQVRISKKALKAGMSFERIGNLFIRQYKENPKVRNVKILFITAPDADYKALGDTAKKVTELTRSLSKILEGMPTECGSCGLKNICDEVEELRELHFGKK